MMHWPFLILALLSTIPAHGLRAQNDQNEDEGPSYSTLVTEIDSLDTERFEPMVQVYVNLTRPGRSKGPMRSLPRSLLESRQAFQCNPSNYILVCPVTEATPCCPPGFPVCCHSSTCCPDGTFCSGLQTCCVNGAVGCGDSCCPQPLVCGTVSGAQTCVNPASSTVAATTEAGSTAISGSGGVSTGTGGSTTSPTSTQSSSQDSSTNVPVIAGAVGGGVGALILIALLAWFLLRDKKKPTVTSEPVGPETMATAYTHGQPPLISPFPHSTSPAYPDGHAPLLTQKANHPWSTNSAPMATGHPYGSTPQGTSYGNGSTPPPGSVAGMMAMSDTGNNGVVGPGGYVPPPPEAVGPGGYVPPPAEDIPTTTSPGPGGSSYYGGASMGYDGRASSPPSSGYAPSRQNTASVAGTMYSNAPWASGVISPSIEQQQQQHRQSLQQHTTWTGVSASAHDQPSATPWTAGVSTPSHDQSLQQPQQPWVHPGLASSPSPMTPPPPPFSPGPGTFGAPPPDPVGSNGGGRQVPMTAPADRKAKPSGSMS